jgi:hypothetical protein
MCGTYDESLLNECFNSRMGVDHEWMYDGWKKGGAHIKEWVNKTQEFIDCTFYVSIFYMHGFFFTHDFRSCSSVLMLVLLHILF